MTTPSTSPVEPGTLYVVATPIGNLGDIAPRAVEVLRGVHRVAAEDTRRTGRLLAHLGFKTPLVSVHEHNERGRVHGLVASMMEGESLALVSDAGTPTVSDPGYRLIQATHEAGLRVVPIPGPSAAMTLVSVSGLPSDRLLFLGFLPPKWAQARRTVEELAPLRASLLFYVSPHKVVRTLALLHEVLGGRMACLGRELTKLHEEIQRAPLDELAQRIQERKPRGEYTLMVAPPDKSRSSTNR